MDNPRPSGIPAWDSIPDDEKPFQRRLMELFAGMTEHVDAQIGRVVDEIDNLGYGTNTLIFYIWGDNGASAEGQSGSISELLAQNGIPTTTKQQMQALDSLGGLRCARFTQDRQHVSRGLGLGRQRTVSGTEAGGFAFRWNTQSDGGSLAGQNQTRCHAQVAIPARKRYCADDL